MDKPVFKVAVSAAMTYGIAGLLVLSAGSVAAADPLVTKAPFSPWTLADPGQFYADLDYLGWSVKGGRLPALITTSPTGTPPAQAGVLGAPGTTVLFGDSAVNDGLRSGARLQTGYWFDRQQSSGIEASVFGLESLSSGYSAASGGTPILARPFANTSTGQQDAQQIAFPGASSGAVSVRDVSRLLGAGALYRQNIWSWGGDSRGESRSDAGGRARGTRPAGPADDAWGSGHVGVLVGYRYRYASDRLDIASTIVSGPVSISVADMFHAASNFHGLDLGLAGDIRKGPWSLEWRGKVALGANLNDAQINGATAITAGGATTVSQGGLLALSSNIGNTSQTRFTVMPEVTMKVGYQVASQWRVVAGYDLMFWPGVKRAGNMVDTTVNPGLLPPPGGGPPPGPPRPQAPPGETSSLLTQGFSVGLKYAY